MQGGFGFATAFNDDSRKTSPGTRASSRASPRLSRETPPIANGKRRPSPYFDAWEPWTTKKWQFIRLKQRAAPGVVWRYAYALETKVLVWGGSLRVLWAKYGEFGGLEVDGFGAPLTSLRPQHDDKLENVEVPSFEEVEISESGFAHCEPAYPKRLPPQFSQKLVVPQTGTLRKMPGFTFFVENSHFHAGNSNQYSVPVDEIY